MTETSTKIELPIENIVVHLFKHDGMVTGEITSDLVEPGDHPDAPGTVAGHVIESMILAHACAGVDVCSDEYIEGLGVAMEAAFNAYA